MTALKNDRFLRALLKQPVDVTPVWMMRQAGRYLPEYRASRAHAGDFMSLCMNPAFACEVTMQPLDRYPQLDAAILFSDILTIPDAMGQGLYFETGEGPRFRKVVSTLADIEALPIPDPHKDLGYVMDAVSTIRRELNGRVPLIGFSGSPWTLATYMVEGGSSKDFRKTKAMLYDNPQAMHLLLDKLAQSVTAYLNGQIMAGAQAVQIFDTWGGNLSAAAYQEFSLAYMRKIVSGLIREHEGRQVPGWPVAGKHRRCRCGRPGPGLDLRYRRGPPSRRQPGRAARQHGPDRAVRQAGSDSRRSRAHPGQLWQRHRTRVQPRPWHHPGSESRPRRRVPASCARIVRAISPVTSRPKRAAPCLAEGGSLRFSVR
jgi:uroporphyrinogen decarboxylase